MTKADRIRELYELGWTVAEIAQEIGCNPAYVRSAWQRRNGDRPCDKAWKSSAEYRDWRSARFHERYHTDAEFRARHKSRNNRYRQVRYATDAEFRARAAAYNAAYYQRRKAGQHAPRPNE